MENQTQIAKRDPRLDNLKRVLEANAYNLAAVIPQQMQKHMTPERVAKIVLSAASRQPKLLECSPMSVLKACITASQLGLECDGILGGAYLVPYYNNTARALEAQFQIGYRGLIDLARRGGQIASIEAHIVRKGDKFHCRLGTDAKIEHEPNFLAEELGEFVCAYAVAKFKDGGMQFEVMTKAQINAIRAMSKSQKFGPWVDHYDEMARKTVIRRLSKFLPLSVDYREAMVAEEEEEEPAKPSAVAGVSLILGEAHEPSVNETSQVLSQNSDGDDSARLGSVFDT